MTSSNLASIKLEGTEARIRKVFKDLNGRATTVIRGGTGVLYISLPSSELGWMDKVVKDIGCKKSELSSFPMHEKALCGTLTVDRLHHEGRCKACARVRDQSPRVRKIPRTPQASPVVPVGKIEPGQEFNLNGVIASLELTHDRMFGQLESLENLMTNLKGYREAAGKLVEYEQEVKDRMSAARNLLSSGKF